jgi:tyrosyl-tRNA synthetase
LKNVYDVLKERGFVEQVTDEIQVRAMFEEPISAYIGFDPTAKSLHVGSLVPIMSLAHLQRYAHRPIALVGGGTGLVGDPSGKTETRKVLSCEEIEENAQALKKQLSQYLDFQNDSALLLNNADWLVQLNYIEFLRDIGRHFSVNRMLAAESYRLRLETGLSFIEFNYMLLQAYDFWYLYHHYGCVLQMGGNDQWGNILAGVDLTRRLDQATVHGLTFPLITTASGEKMGKTAAGAVWLDKKLTSPYHYYQYWINTDDRDVERFLALFTFLPMKEVRDYGRLKGADLRRAKEFLAFETTRITHGEEEARKAQEAARSLFGKDTMVDIQSATHKLTSDHIQIEVVPTFKIPRADLEKGLPAFKLFVQTKLCSSSSEARRLIEQGGGYINEERVEQFDQLIGMAQAGDGSLLLRAGKKKYHRVEVVG